MSLRTFILMTPALVFGGSVAGLYLLGEPLAALPAEAAAYGLAALVPAGFVGLVIWFWMITGALSAGDRREAGWRSPAESER